MPSIRFSEGELLALSGLPHLSIVLYMLGIRPRMDFANGTVGVSPLISWQALRESVYVEPHQGIKHEYASYDAVRRAAGWLEKAGLIRMRSRERQLIFFLPLAHADLSVQIKAARGTPDKPARGTPDRNPHGIRLEADYPQSSRQTDTPKAATHPETGKTVDLTRPPSDLDSTGAVDKSGRAVGQDGFIFPKAFGPDKRAAMALKLQGVGVDIGQAVLDELAGCIQAGGVRNQVALLNKFIEQAKAGEFCPDKGEAIRAGREAEKRAAAVRAEQEKRASEEAAKFAASSGAGKPPSLKALIKRTSVIGI